MRKMTNRLSNNLLRENNKHRHQFQLKKCFQNVKLSPIIISFQCVSQLNCNQASDKRMIN